MNKITNETLTQAQIQEIEFQTKLEVLNMEQDKLNAYSWLAYSIIVGAAVYLITL